MKGSEVSCRYVQRSKVKWMFDSIRERIKKQVKLFGERFFRAVKGYSILEISLEMGTIICQIEWCSLQSIDRKCNGV